MKKIILLIFVCILITTQANANIASSDNAFITWNRTPDAVMYEILIKKRYYKDIFLVKERKISYVPGVAVKLSSENLYYQVRPLDVNKQPMMAFTSNLPISKKNINNKMIVLGDYDKVPNSKLYQVFSWIPLDNVEYYKVKIYKSEENKYRQVREYKVLGQDVFDYYDKKPYVDSGEYAWSVTGYDNQNNQITGESDKRNFVVDNKETAIASLGDSITHGGGAVSNPPSYPEYNWQTYTDYKIRNLGYSGNTVDDLINRFNNDVLPFNPKTLIILAGINDIRQGRKSDYVIQKLNLLKNKCIINNIIPIFVSLPPLNPENMDKVLGAKPAEYWKQEEEKVNLWIKQQEYNINIYDELANYDGTLKNNLSVDGLHPDVEGKKIIGRTVNEYIKMKKISTI